MIRAIIYFLAGTVVSLILNSLFAGSLGWKADLFHAVSFGLGWGLAYFVDRPLWPLVQKMGISFVGVALLLAIGLVFFNLEIAVSSVIKFSTVFVAYYLIASFRESKSLRN